MSSSYVIDVRNDPHNVKTSDLIIGALGEDIDARLLAPSFLRCHANELESLARQLAGVRDMDGLKKPRNALEVDRARWARARLDELIDTVEAYAGRCRCVSELHYRIEDGALDRALGEERGASSEEDEPSTVRATRVAALRKAGGQQAAATGDAE